MADCLNSAQQLVLKLIQFLQQHSYNIQHRNQQHYHIPTTNHQLHPTFMAPGPMMPPPTAALISTQPVTIHHHSGPTIRIAHPLQPRMIPHLYNRARVPPPRIH